MIRKFIVTTYFFLIYTPVRHKIQVLKNLAEKVFSIRHYSQTLCQNAADKILKTPLEFYDIYILFCEVLLSKPYNEYKSHQVD